MWLALRGSSPALFQKHATERENERARADAIAADVSRPLDDASSSGAAAGFIASSARLVRTEPGC